MKFQVKAVIIAGALALSASPALAAGPPSSTPPSNQGTAHAPTTTPGPDATLPAKAKAYGSYCKAESKRHVEGVNGTPFSTCVTAMAKLANDQSSNPRTACEDESKTHVAGEKGTPFSQCVSAGAKLQADENAASEDGDTTPAS